MDQYAVAANANHYDKHALKYASAEEAERARREGPARPLKIFHNTIKKDLIEAFKRENGKLIDFACGRAGDLHKWFGANLAYVKGYDISYGELEEAQLRYRELKRNFPHAQLVFETQQTDQLGVEILQDPHAPYDLASCMFALHYFCTTEFSLRTFLQTVVCNLANGGFFIVCIPDGKKVVEYLHGHSVFHDGMLTIRQYWEGQPECFGSGFAISIEDTVVQEHADGSTEGSYEYLVFFNVLLRIAREYRLFPVHGYGASADRHFLEEDLTQPVKHFNPRYPQSHPSLELSSRLYAAVVFQKRDRTAPPPP